MKNKIQIKILDSIHCQIEKRDIPRIQLCLQYRKFYWRQTKFSRKRYEYTASLIDKKSGIFLTGFLSRVKRYCNNLSIPYEIIGEEDKFTFFKDPSLTDITFREDQLQLIESIKKKQRGIILSATGSGKTILISSIASMLPKTKIIILCHTVSIKRQTYKKLKGFGFKNIILLEANNREEFKNYNIVISTIQTFIGIDSDSYKTHFDIVIIDEAHHINKLDSQYGKVLQHFLSPIKIGFTATLPEKREEKLVLEGLIGPVIGEFTVQEGIEKGILAMPKIKLIPVPLSSSLSIIRRYALIYEKCIIFNRGRNSLIIRASKERVERNKTVLIMIKNIEHGNELVKISSLYKLDIQFIHGDTPEEMRENLRVEFDEKRIKCVIASVVWKEGIDIPSLDCIVNAAGGKKELATLQLIGRGVRTTETKSEVEIIDFLDPYFHLAQHSILRIQTYVKNGWL